MNIIPAILEKDFDEIKRKYDLVSRYCELVQIDMADGNFVENTTFLDFYRFSEIKGVATLELHLMTENILSYLDSKIPNVSSICVHVESMDFNESALSQLWVLGYKIGVCLNPETSTDILHNFIDKVDFVQFLAVQPGVQGGDFIDSVLDKIKDFKKLYPDVEVQIDGGINNDSISKLLNLGVDNVVIGSAIFAGEDPVKNLIEFKTAYGNK